MLSAKTQIVGGSLIRLTARPILFMVFPILVFRWRLNSAAKLSQAWIYNPATNELFTGEKGRGSYLDDRRLRVSGRDELNEAVIASGVPHRGRADLEKYRGELAVMQEKVAGIRRLWRCQYGFGLCGLRAL